MPGGRRGSLDSGRLVKVGVAVGLFGVLHIGGGLVETNLLGHSLSSFSVLGTGLVLEDRVDLFE